jgi:hypothetical protein
MIIKNVLHVHARRGCALQAYRLMGSSTLPPELLLRIMQQLPLPQRLAGPARVCKAWAAAAVAATTTISINNERWVHPGLGVWLQKHGAGVEQMDVCIGQQSEYGVEIRQNHDGYLYLPTAKLQQLTSLSFKGTALQLSPDLALQTGAPSSSNIDVVAALPNLVDLHLEECSVSSKADLLQLVGAAGLSSLHLENVSWRAGSQEGMDRLVLPMAVVPILGRCSSLVTLHLHFYWDSLDMTAPHSFKKFVSISRLQHLKDLALVLPSDAPADFLPSVPINLTYLGLKSFHRLGLSHQHQPVVLQQIPQLQHLQSLRIDSLCGFDPASLVSMTQLLRLHLEGVSVQTIQLARMPHLQQLVLEDCSTAESAASALAALGHLSQLQVLKLLHWVKFERGEPSLLHAAPVAGLSALTASTKLQQLHVNCRAMHGRCGSAFPDGAVAHMFPSGRVLEQLVVLHLGPEKAFIGFDGFLSGEDLDCIAAACPRLQSLHIKGSLKAGKPTDALLQLKECHTLSVGGVAHAFDDRAAAVVAQMTQLTHLSWCCSRGFTSMGLQLMTALTNLQRLVITPMTEDYGRHHEMEADLVAMFGMEGDAQPLAAVLLNHEVRSHSVILC